MLIADVTKDGAVYCTHTEKETKPTYFKAVEDIKNNLPQEKQELLLALVTLGYIYRATSHLTHVWETDEYFPVIVATVKHICPEPLSTFNHMEDIDIINSIDVPILNTEKYLTRAVQSNNRDVALVTMSDDFVQLQVAGSDCSYLIQMDKLTKLTNETKLSLVYVLMCASMLSFDLEDKYLLEHDRHFTGDKYLTLPTGAVSISISELDNMFHYNQVMV